MSDVLEALPAIWTKFAKLTHPDWAPGQFEFVWADGSTLVAEHDGEIGDFFQRHPYFERAEVLDTAERAELAMTGQARRVWLSHREPPPQDAPWSHRELPASRDLPLPADFFEPPFPDEIAGRPCDLWLSGALDPGYDIFAVHPDVEALWYVWSDGDGPHEDRWNAKIWLKHRG
jgi:hypothetical protein